MASWKISQGPVEEKKIEHASFANASKFFAVDASGSTWGAPIESEKQFVVGVHDTSTRQEADSIALWGTRCDNPTNNWERFDWSDDRGGTYPAEILRNENALRAILASDIWFLLTDGEVWENEVHDLAGLSQAKGLFSVPTVFLITSTKRNSPNESNVSVGITSYANCADAVCLFKDYTTGQIYVIAGKGCFEKLDQAKDHDTWEGLASFKDESELLKRISELEIQVPTSDTRANLPTGLDLGAEWNSAYEEPTLVDLEKLLAAGNVSDEDLQSLLTGDALDILTLACKSRNKQSQFRQFLQSHRVQEIAVQLEDIHGAGDLIRQLGEAGLSDEQKGALRLKLREAHAKNRAHYMDAKDNDKAADAVRDKNRLIDAALRNLAEVEKASFTADLLSRRSNRARRADAVGQDQLVEVSAMNFDGPSFKGYCPICCGDDEVMSIALKVLDQEAAAANTADFALDFPLAAGRFEANQEIVASQAVCFQCALFGRPGYTMVGEPISAVVPTLEYTGSNKQYINQQLYLALNNGLKTGVPTLGQLFATVLDRTLQSKAWAGAGSAESDIKDPEVLQRQKTMKWLMGNILENLHCRETFSELGKWCKYPEALKWAAADLQANGLTSWAINYPVSGFMQLLRFGQLTNVFSDEVIQQMKATKLLHTFVSVYLATLRQPEQTRVSGKKSLLQMMYTEFNSELVPRDLEGPSTIQSSVTAFWETFTTFLAIHQELLANWTEADKANMMPRIQVLAFWLIHFQLSHTTAKTYFTTLRTTEPLALALLDPTTPVPGAETTDILLTPFLRPADFARKREAALHGMVPYATPFGASVLHCGGSGCAVSFVPAEVGTAALESVEWTPQLLDGVRQLRAKHLIEVFGASEGFKKNQTGLPEPTVMPSRPSSVHTTLHMSVARAWAKLEVDVRRKVARAVESGVVEGESQVEAFVVAVREEVCRGGRGDIFDRGLDRDIRDVLPSFLAVLKEALVLKGGDGEDVAVYEHDFLENKLESKIKYEIAAKKLRAVSGGRDLMRQ